MIHRSIWKLIVVLGVALLNLSVVHARTEFVPSTYGAGAYGYIDTCLIVGKGVRQMNATKFIHQFHCIDIQDGQRRVYAFTEGTSNHSTRASAEAAMQRNSKLTIGDLWTVNFLGNLEVAQGNGYDSTSPAYAKSTVYLSSLKEYEAKVGVKETKLVTLSDVLAENLGKTEQQIIEASANPPKATYQITKDWYFKRWVHNYLYGHPRPVKKGMCNIDVFFNQQRKMVSWRSDCLNGQMKLPQKTIPVDRPFQNAPELPREIDQLYKNRDYSEVK